MEVPPPYREAFEHFLQVNSALSRIEDHHENPRDVILVDLLSHDANHSVRALQVGRYIKRHRHGRLVAVVGNLLFAKRLNFVYDKSDAIRLARSYGVTEFIDLEVALDPERRLDVGDACAALLTKVDVLRSEELGAEVMNWRAADGCHIGHYLYEATLRVSRHPFLHESRGDLKDLAREAEGIFQALSSFCAQNRVNAYVAGHTCYTQWGMVADIVLRSGGQVVWFDHFGNFSAYLLSRAPQSGETLDGLIRKIDKDEYEREFENRRAIDPVFFSRLEAVLLSNQFLKPFWRLPTSPAPEALAQLLRRSALAKLGWDDHAGAVACVFMHCFADVPRSDEQLYEDYYEWIAETLKIAAADQSKKWIIKTHPANASYDISDTVEHLKRDYAQCSNIRFLDDQLFRAELVSVCDLAVTVRGSVSYEMSVAGVPVLLAGRSFVSDLGFCYLATTVEEYKRLLTTDFAQLKLTDGMRERLDFYLLYEKVLRRVESTLIPFWNYQLSGGGIVWNQLSDRLLHHISDLDPAAAALKAMLEGRGARTRYLGSGHVATQPGTGTRAAARPYPATACGREISFARGAEGQGNILSEASNSDEAGSWFGQGGALVGLLITSDSASDATNCFRLQICFHVDRPENELRVLVNGRHIDGSAATIGTWTGLATGPEPRVERGYPLLAEISLSESGESAVFQLDAIKVDEMKSDESQGNGRLDWLTRIFRWPAASL